MGTNTKEAAPELTLEPVATSVVPMTPAPGLPTVAPTPSDVLLHAMDKGASIEQLHSLLELQMKWEANEARKAYFAALAAFKSEPLRITKNKRVYFKSKDPNKPATDYMHATLDNVVNVVAPALARNQLSHNWQVRRDAARIHVTCRLTHAMGHFEEVTLDGPLDDSGNKNNIQQAGSTITYLERYTLLAITGLATEEQGDDDGHSADGAPDLGETWAKKAKAAPSLKDLEEVWAEGVRAINEAQDADAYETFKGAVNQRKAAIEKAHVGNSTRPSRMANIVNRSKPAATHGLPGADAIPEQQA